MITTKRKRYSGHWIMQGGERIGEAWKYPHHTGFGMTIGGHGTIRHQVYWRNGKPAKWGFTSVSAPRLMDLVEIAEKHFGSKQHEHPKA